MTIDVFPGPMSKPAIAPDGTVYIIEQEADSRLRAMTPAGATKWIVDVPGEAQTTRRAPVIGPNGTIYAYTYGVLYAVSPEGKLLWKSPPRATPPSTAVASSTLGARDKTPVPSRH